MARKTDLSGEEFGRRVSAGVVGRDVNVSVNIILGGSLNDTLYAVDVHVGIGKVPACYK